MSIKPILFSTPMVQAILAGRKSMTRRVVKNVPDHAHWVERNNDGSFGFMYGIYSDGFMGDGWKSIFPRYHEGDILWVRETWGDVSKKYEYRADFNDSENTDRTARYGKIISRWRPSIHMPRLAARLFLRITDVRVERLQDITEVDAVYEGIARGYGLNNAECFAGGCYNGDFDKSCAVCDVPVSGFMQLWDRLNAKRGYGWDTNPWVWVYSFERCEAPE